MSERDQFTEEQIEKINHIAGKVIETVRTALTVQMLFLNSAIYRLEPTPYECDVTSTDGESYYYDPLFVVKSYQAANELPTHQYLHSLMHCIFRHMFVGILQNTRYWDLACDIAAEAAIIDLNQQIVHIDLMDEQKIEIRKFADNPNIKHVSAEWLYKFFLENPPTENELVRLESIFKMDDHAIWYDRDGFLGIDSSTGNVKGRGTPSQNVGDSSQNVGDDMGGENETINNSYWSTQEAQKKEQLEKMWQDISKKVQTGAEEYNRKAGNQPGHFMMELDMVNREKYDYTSFLKKFAVIGEAMKISQDEFDYVYYTYGMSLYDNMPLIEPLEYREVKRIKDFVIALDTSGSTLYENNVQKFVTKTYNILKSTESFFTRFNIHIIQCDCRVLEDKKITSQQEFDDYVKTIKLKGFGGTSFVPVFEYVEQLIEDKEFSNLKGLIYFTDCRGDFPEVPPNYTTAFISINDGDPIPPTPPWAIQMILEEEDI